MSVVQPKQKFSLYNFESKFSFIMLADGSYVYDRDSLIQFLGMSQLPKEMIEVGIKTYALVNGIKVV